MDKASLRKTMKALRAQLPEGERIAAAEAIGRALFSQLFASATYASYVSIGAEVPTAALHAAILKAQGVVFVPKQAPEAAGGYTWSRLGSACQPGAMGIPEPQALDQVGLDSVQAAFIPGLAFDLHGGRLGYGGGVYDRLLLQLPEGALRIAVCYDCQVVERVPQEAHDLRMDYLVTPTRMVDCRGGRSA